MVRYITDEYGIKRFDFKTLEDYKEVYKSDKPVYPNIDLDTRTIRNNYRWKIVTELIKSSGMDDIIDFGCGDGGLCFLLERLNFSCDGVEIDPVVAKANQTLARGWGSKCRFFSSSIEEFTTQKLYNIALVLDVFEHFLNWKVAMKSIEACVQKGGLIIITTPEIDGTFGCKDNSAHHINLHSEESLVQCFPDKQIKCLETMGDIIFLMYER